jgi:hypothetical protein
VNSAEMAEIISSNERIPFRGLPTIGIDSGPVIDETLKALIRLCQQEMPTIVSALKTMKHPMKKVVVIDNEALKPENDPHKLKLEACRRQLKDAHMDERKAVEAFTRLFGIMCQMMSLELEEKVSNSPEFAKIESETDPIGLWGLITAAVISKQGGGTRAKKTEALHAWATLSQKKGESVTAYRIRASQLLANLKLVKAEEVSDIDQAARFIHGLEQRFWDLKSYLSNNEAMGNDTHYPKDLTRAATLASLWTANAADSGAALDDAASKTAFASVSRPNSKNPKKGEKEKKNGSKDTVKEKADDDGDDETVKCYFCEGDHKRHACQYYAEYLKEHMPEYKAAQAIAKKKSDSEASKGAQVLSAFRSWQSNEHGYDDSSDEDTGSADLEANLWKAIAEERKAIRERQEAEDEE